MEIHVSVTKNNCSPKKYSNLFLNIFPSPYEWPLPLFKWEKIWGLNTVNNSGGGGGGGGGGGILFTFFLFLFLLFFIHNLDVGTHLKMSRFPGFWHAHRRRWPVPEGRYSQAGGDAMCRKNCRWNSWWSACGTVAPPSPSVTHTHTPRHRSALVVVSGTCAHARTHAHTHTHTHTHVSTGSGQWNVHTHTHAHTHTHTHTQRKFWPPQRKKHTPKHETF